MRIDIIVITATITLLILQRTGECLKKLKRIQANLERQPDCKNCKRYEGRSINMKFKVRVQVSDNCAFESDVYAVNGNEFLLYNKMTGFGWYSFGSVNGDKPMITLVRENEE